MVPGQRIVETELAERFAVGRNAVREAVQHLAARGVVDLSPNRSPAIRRLGVGEAEEVLDVAEAMTRLMVRKAAERLDRQRHDTSIDGVRAALRQVVGGGPIRDFSQARRQFYRVLLTIGGNRELQRLFPMIGMHLIYAQPSSDILRDVRLADYGAILDAVTRGDVNGAEELVTAHIGRVRQALTERPY